MTLRVVVEGSPLRDGRRQAGIGRYVHELSRALRSIQGLELYIALPAESRSLNMAVNFLKAQPSLVTKAVASRAQVVHATANLPVGWPVRRQVVTLHDALMWTTHAPAATSPTGRFLDIERRRFRRCAAVIVPSQTAADEAALVLDVPPDRIHLVPWGVADVFSATASGEDAMLRRNAGVTEGPYIFWVGQLGNHDPRKSLDELITATKALGDQMPNLVLAGSAWGEAARLADVAAGVGVNLITPGYVDDPTLAALYRGAAAVAVPSRHEGFGFTILEAFACGAPVVAARGGNIPSLAGDAALLVPPGNVAELARALRDVLLDGEVGRQLRAAGPKRAAQFTWRRTAERTVDVYRSVLTRKQ